MKIIRTPLDWESNPDDNWLHSVDYIETADISVDELDSESRTGTVTFTQDETSDQKEVTVIQKRATFYYSVGTNYGPGATFNIGGELVVSDENGVATRVWTSIPGSTAPETMPATPETDIRALAVNPSSVWFPAEGGDADETFIWTDWNKTGVTVHRSANAVPQVFINSGTSEIDAVTDVSGPNWLALTNDGSIHADVNTGNERTGEVIYINYGKTATVQVNQEEKPITEKYFGVKTTSKLAEDQHVTFTVDEMDLPPVNFSKSGEYYIATITALSEANVSASCDISDFTIGVSPGELYFDPEGGTKTVTVTAEKRLLQANHQTLTGCTDLSDLTKLFTIVENTGTCGYNSEVVSGGEYFTINDNLITASKNESELTRIGKAKFTHAEDEGKNETVVLTQENINYFIFKSTVIGSPSTGQVFFYDNEYCAGEPFTAITYGTTGDTQKVDEQIYINVNKISYKIEGFEPKGSISADTNSVTFSPIEMVYNSDDEKYHLSNIEKEVGVTAIGVSYVYQKRVDGQGKTYTDYQDYLSGAISASSVVEVNATADTTNRFTVSEFPNTWNNSWSYTTNFTSGVTVTTKATIPVFSGKTMTLTYALEGVPTVSATTDFILPSNATENIELQNFALSSKTAFMGALRESGGVPTGNSAYTFAFWPSTRYPMGAASALTGVTVAEMRYRVKSDGDSGTSGWMLFYPYKPNDGQVAYPEAGKAAFANYVAKVYALSYRNAPPSSTGKNDSWSLGPLLYKSASTEPYIEVDGFKFLQTGGFRVSVCQTDAQTDSWPHKPAYPSVCPFSDRLSESSYYFTFSDPVHASTSSTAGVISNSGRTWTISGNAQGGIYSTNNFINRTIKMITRNQGYSYTEVTACDQNPVTAPSPDAMAHVISGQVQTNLLGVFTIKAIYHGNINGFDDSSPGYHIPADSYVVTPRNPGDTTSVIYDAETNTYLIYDIDSVIVLDRVTNLITPEADLIDFKVPIEGEIIGPSHP